MRKTTLGFGLVMGLVSAGLGEARAEQKSVAASAPAGPPRPAPELARLQPLAGSWTCQGTSPAGAMGPGSPEMKYHSTFKVTATANGFGWTLAYDQAKSKTHPLHFAGYWTAAWDSAEKRLTFFWVDNVGNVGIQSGGDWTGDDYVISGEGSGMAGRASVRDTLTRKGPNGLHWKGELKPAGATAWMTLGEDDCKR